MLIGRFRCFVRLPRITSIVPQGLTSRACSSAPSGSSDDPSIVQTTGYSFPREGRRVTTSGVFWKQGDPRNTVRTLRDDRTYVAARLRSIIIALEQAKAAGLSHVTIQSDLETVLKFPNLALHLNKWADADFARYDGKLMPNADLLDKLHNLLNEGGIKVNFEYKNWTERLEESEDPSKPKFSNAIMRELLASRPKDYKNPFIDLSTRNEDELNPIGKKRSKPATAERERNSLPTVYVASRIEQSGRKNFMLASWSMYWLPESLEHIPLEQRPRSRASRMIRHPITHFRAQLDGILEALYEARSRGLTDIRVITDSMPFLHFFKIGWLKINGDPVPNHFYYRRIKEISDEVQVNFRAERVDPNNAVWQKASEMAEAGLRYPAITRDVKEYSMTLEEMLEGRNDVEALKNTDTLRVRIFKREKGCPGGYFFDRMNGMVKEGDDSLNEAATRLVSGNCEALLLRALQECSALGEKHAVIRTNNSKLAKYTLGYLELWARLDWRDSNGVRLKEIEQWKGIHRLLADIQLTWDVISTVDEDADANYLASHRQKCGPKKGQQRKEADGSTRKKTKTKKKKSAAKKRTKTEGDVTVPEVEDAVT